MSVDIAEALLTMFLYRRKFQDIPLYDRPIMNTVPKLHLKHEIPHDQVIQDEFGDLACDLDNIYKVSRLVEDRPISVQHFFLILICQL